MGATICWKKPPEEKKPKRRVSEYKEMSAKLKDRKQARRSTTKEGIVTSYRRFTAEPAMNNIYSNSTEFNIGRTAPSTNVGTRFSLTQGLIKVFVDNFDIKERVHYIYIYIYIYIY